MQERIIIKQNYKKILRTIIYTLLLSAAFFTLMFLSYKYLDGYLGAIITGGTLGAGTVYLVVFIVSIISYPKIRRSDHPIAIVTPEGIELNYTIDNTVPRSGTFSLRLIAWGDIVETGLFQNAANSYITITLSDPDLFIEQLDKQEKKVARFYNRMCGTPVAFLVTMSTKPAHEIKKDINFYHATISQGKTKEVSN